MSYTATTLHPTVSARSVALGCIGLLRTRQWIKNAFVLAPLLFAGELGRVESIQRALWTCFSFCLLASSLYVLNDWFDRTHDREHPAKRGRPLASGAVPGGLALAFSTVLFTAAIFVANSTAGPAVATIELVYAALNVLYSAGLKRVVILDVFIIAAGFVLRVLAGASAVAVPASHWIVLCTFLLALFLGFTKRKNELATLAPQPAVHRPVLRQYSPELIGQMNMVVCTATVVCYAIYTVAPETVAKFHTDRLLYSVPFVIYGLFRYLFVSQQPGAAESPTDALFRDRPLLLCIFLWVACCGAVIYWPGGNL